MGAAVALRAAVDEPRIRALVLEAPYADLRPSVAIGLGRKRLPPWLAGPMLRRAGRIAGVALDRPGPIELAPRLTIPALVLHGEADAIAPPSEVQRLIAALPGLTVVIAVPEADHNEVFDRGGEALADRVVAFLDAAIARTPDTGSEVKVQSPG